MNSILNETETVYQTLRRFWRTTEAFDTIRGRMPPDGVYLFNGHVYFVSQSISIRVPIPKQDIQLFTRAEPSLEEHKGWLTEKEDMKAVTTRHHPYKDLGPRPNNYHRLFEGRGATMREINRLFETHHAKTHWTIDVDAIRSYISLTSGTRGNGDSGFVVFEDSEETQLRFIRTPRGAKAIAVENRVPLTSSTSLHQTIGVSPAALLYALRFVGGRCEIDVRDGYLSIRDLETDARVVLAARSKDMDYTIDQH